MIRSIRGSDLPAVAVVLASLAGAAVFASGVTARHDVWFVNALPIAVEASVDGRSVAVPANERRALRLDVGEHHAHVADERGQAITDETLVVAPLDPAVVVNVAAVAPLFLQRSEYAARPGEDEGQTQFAGLAPFVPTQRIDDVFRESPEVVAADDKASARIALRLAPGGYASSIAFLTETGQADAALGVALRASDAQGGRDLAALSLVPPLVALTRGPAPGAELARQLLVLHPGTLDLERSYQVLAVRSGAGDRVRAEYAERAAKEPTARNVTLRARVESPVVATKLLDEAKPENGEAVRTLRLARATALFLAGDYDAALPAYEAIRADPDYRFYVGEHARVLVATGKPMDALARVAEVATQPNAVDERLALLYADVARAAGRAAVARALIDRLADGADRFRLGSLLALAGEKVTTHDVESVGAPELRAALLADLDAQTSADKATAHLAAQPRAIDHVAPVVLLLLALEADRIGDAATAARLYGGLRDVPCDPRDLSLYVREGKASPDVERLDPELRAALAFVHARALAAAGDAEHAANERTRSVTLDVLGGYVSRARAAWSDTTTRVVFRR